MENTDYTVAVIEAGSFYEIDNANYSQIPAYDIFYSSTSPSNAQPLVDWGIVTTPQNVRLFLEASMHADCIQAIGQSRDIVLPGEDSRRRVCLPRFVTISKAATFTDSPFSSARNYLAYHR